MMTVPLDAVARMAARLAQAPMAVVSLVAAEQEEFLGMFGLPQSLAAVRRGSGEHLVCAYVVLADTAAAVGDMAADHDFIAHRMFTEYGIRAFAGVPLRNEQGQPIGAVTVLDTTPRTWTDDQLAALEAVTEMLGPIPASSDPAAAMSALSSLDQHSTRSVPGTGTGTGTDGEQAVSTAVQADVQGRFITALLDSLQIGVFAVDTRQQPVLFNRALRRIYDLPDDLTAEQALDGAYRQLHHLDGTPITTGDLAAVRALQGHRIRDSETVLRAPHLPDRYLLANAEPIRGTTGEIIGAVSTIHEVTERRRREHFRDCELHVAGILNASDTLEQAAPPVLAAVGHTLRWQHLALLLVDEIADVLRPTAQWNAPGIHLQDLTPEAIPHRAGGLGHVWDTGQPLWLPDLTDPTHSATPEGRAIAHAIAERGLRAGLLVPVRDGDTVLGVLTALTATSEFDQFLLTGLLENVAAQLGQFLSRRRRAELALQLAHAEDDFLTLVGHELRTPLTSIISSSSLLTDELDDPDLQSLAATITRNADSLQAIINDLLELAALESGHHQISPRLTDLTPIIAAAIAATPRPDGLRLHTDLPPTLTLDADPDRLRQIIEQLLSNAIKYSPHGGDIHISAHDHDSGIVELAIADTGIGIPADDRGTLFTRFHRAVNARHTTIGGTGLGLALVRALVHAHHGTITHDTTHHPGTRITVRLPRHQTAH